MQRLPSLASWLSLTIALLQDASADDQTEGRGLAPVDREAVDRWANLHELCCLWQSAASPAKHQLRPGCLVYYEQHDANIICIRRTLLEDIQALLHRDYVLPAGTTASLEGITLAGVHFTRLALDGSGQMGFTCSCMGMTYTDAVIDSRCAGLGYASADHGLA